MLWGICSQAQSAESFFNATHALSILSAAIWLMSQPQLLDYSHLAALRGFLCDTWNVFYVRLMLSNHRLTACVPSWAARKTETSRMRKSTQRSTDHEMTPWTMGYWILTLSFRLIESSHEVVAVPALLNGPSILGFVGDLQSAFLERLQRRSALFCPT